MKPITVGFLPLYIALYDQSNPELRPRLEAFYERMAHLLEERGLIVLRSPAGWKRNSPARSPGMRRRGRRRS